jgi:hypothetical protein
VKGSKRKRSRERHRVAEVEEKKQKVRLDETLEKDAVQRGTEVSLQRIKSEYNSFIREILVELKGPC